MSYRGIFFIYSGNLQSAIILNPLMPEKVTAGSGRHYTFRGARHFVLWF
jgi:hypothetical protein